MSEIVQTSTRESSPEEQARAAVEIQVGGNCTLCPLFSPPLYKGERIAYLFRFSVSLLETYFVCDDMDPDTPVNIQRHYRGHRERRQLRGHGLTPTQRWNEVALSFFLTPRVIIAKANTCNRLSKKRTTAKSPVLSPAKSVARRTSPRLRSAPGRAGVGTDGFQSRKRSGIKRCCLRDRYVRGVRRSRVCVDGGGDRRNTTMNRVVATAVTARMRGIQSGERRSEKRGDRKGYRRRKNESSIRKLWICSMSLSFPC